MAHKKAAGSAKNLRDSKPKYRWVKLFGGQTATAGNIIIRQKWEKFVAGDNTYVGRDRTIHASIDGVVSFSKTNVKRFDGRKYLKTVVNVLPHGEEKKAVVAKATKELAPKTEKKVVAKASAKKASLVKAKAEPKAAAKKVAPAKKPVAKKASPRSTVTAAAKKTK